MSGRGQYYEDGKEMGVRFAGMGCGCDMIFGDDKRTGMKCMMRGVDEDE